MGARKAAVVVVAALLIAAPPFSAAAADSAPGAIGGTVGVAAIATILCWTAAYVERRSEAAATESEDATPQTGASSVDGDRPDAAYDRRGWLVGLDGSLGIQNFQQAEQEDLREALQPFNTSLAMNSNTGGLSGRVGYRCNRRFSAEVQVAWLQPFEGVIIEQSQRAIATATYRPIFTSVNARAYALTGRYQPYLLIGGGALNVVAETNDLVSQAGSVSTTNTMFTMRFGFGIEIYATKNVVVNVGTSYVLPVTDIDNFEYFTVDAGLEYRF